ncbi:hypothetical protein [Nannocystis sp.]|uniref:hypothetical protein n=1 Tax=Nannocystis sp. TaxID=1962667 RepID=UPI0025D31921|nr:hypothetical protein [Nannocystis sp.]MBK7829144.1 hypothetical protein [Nannocystis sp.]
MLATLERLPRVAGMPTLGRAAAAAAHMASAISWSSPQVPWYWSWQFSSMQAQ